MIYTNLFNFYRNYTYKFIINNIYQYIHITYIFMYSINLYFIVKKDNIKGKKRIKYIKSIFNNKSI